MQPTDPSASVSIPYVPDLRRRLQAGEPLVGTWVSLLDPMVTELLAGSGFDFLCADGEHGPVATGDLAVMAMAARAAGVPVLYRVAANEPVRIMHALDAGAAGVVVPQVRSVADAELAAAWCRYPPAGLRGIAPRRVADYGRRTAGYLASANAQVTCCVQIETREALSVLQAILGVAGIDAVLVGPNDLAAALGHTGDLEHAEVEAAIARVLAAGREAGVPVGIWTPSVAVARARLSQGFAFVTVGADYGFLREAADRAVTDLHAEA